MKITYIGHSFLILNTGRKNIFIDPWIDGNPFTSNGIGYFASLSPSAICVSHGHSDHGFLEAVEISKKTGARIIGTFELVKKAGEMGADGIPGNVGGKIKIENIEISLVNAVHSCPFSVPVGFVIKDEKTTLYHAGDTAVSQDMSLIGEMFRPDISFLPIGGTFTMGIEDIPTAKKLIKNGKFFGMHFNSFPPITVDLDEAKKNINILDFGETFTV